MFNLIILAAETIKTPTPEVQYPFDWRPLISSIIFCIIAGFINWWFTWHKGKAKRDTNHFIAFMDESAEFREEVRKDRERLRGELEMLHKERSDYKKVIQEWESKYEKCAKIVDRHTVELEEAKDQIAKLNKKIVRLKEQLHIINGEQG